MFVGNLFFVLISNIFLGIILVVMVEIWMFFWIKRYFLGIIFLMEVMIWDDD